MATKTRRTRKIVVKSTAKRGAKPAARAVKRPAKKAIAKPVRKRVEKRAARSEMKLIAKPAVALMPSAKPATRPVQQTVKKPLVRSVVIKPITKAKLRQTQSAIASAEARRTLRLARMPQFAYMKPPSAEHAFEVGHTVEVFCDHERNSDRIRGWVKGIVVQVDNKLVAVQFRSNVYLTDGWMVPDHILWYPITSDQIRAETFAKKGSKKDIPEY
jgi:hypothetical protein